MKSNAHQLKLERGNVEPHQAFTLVELLVAAGVVVILAALLLPVTSRLVEQGRTTSCQSTLRNLATAMTIFRADRNQRLWDRSPTADGGEGDIAPARALYRAGVIATGKEMRCPVAKTSEQGAWKTGGSGTVEYVRNLADQYVSYAVNDIAFYRSSPYMMSTTPINTFRHFAGHESRTPSFMDGSFFQLNDRSWRGAERFARLSLRHQNHCHVLFLDGHVESLDREGVKMVDPYGGTNPRWWADFGAN